MYPIHKNFNQYRVKIIKFKYLLSWGLIKNSIIAAESFKISSSLNKLLDWLCTPLTHHLTNRLVNISQSNLITGSLKSEASNNNLKKQKYLN